MGLNGLAVRFWQAGASGSVDEILLQAGNLGRSEGLKEFHFSNI